MTLPDASNPFGEARFGTIAVGCGPGIPRPSPLFTPGRLSSGELPAWLVYIDGQKIGPLSLACDAIAWLPEGLHSVQVRSGWWMSDIVQVDLRPGERARLLCDFKGLIQGRLFKDVERIIKFVIIPVALVGYFSKAVVQFIEQYFKEGFLALLGLFLLSITIGFSRMFSRKPGAMISLSMPAQAEQHPPPDS